MTSVMALLVCAFAGLAFAHPHFRERVPNAYSVGGTSAVGHTSHNGGGQLCNFGSDFKNEKFRWTKKLCQMDSDGDGESNGLELGDPCCIWKPGDIPTRTWRITHPGGTESGVAASGSTNEDFIDAMECHLAMPTNCSDIAAAGAQQRNETLFWKFYYRRHGNMTGVADSLAWVASSIFQVFSDPTSITKGMKGSGSGGVLFGSASVNIASAIIAAELALFVWMGTKRAWNKMPAREKIVMVFYSLLYMDFTSGILHIILDNPLFNTWPGIGASAIAFQNHHKDPTGITRGLYINFLREHHLLVAVCVGTFIGNHRHAKLRMFLAWAVPSSTLMMAAHRWSHTQPEDLGMVVAFMQGAGLLISQSSHSQHHVSYDVNFAILNGWSHPILNFSSKSILPAGSVNWFFVLVFWCLLPLILSYKKNLLDPIGLLLEKLFPARKRVTRNAKLPFTSFAKQQKHTKRGL